MTKCEACGTVISAAVAAGGVCPACGAVLQVAPPTPPASPFPMPETTQGEVESFGSYGRAADELWIDPAAAQLLKQSEETTIPLPPEIQALRDGIQRRRQIYYGILVAIGAITLVGMGILYLMLPAPAGGL